MISYIGRTSTTVQTSEKKGKNVTFHFRKYGNVVVLNFSNKTNSAIASNETVVTADVGFRPKYDTSFITYDGYGSYGGWNGWQIKTTGVVSPRNHAVNNNQSVYGTVAYIVD